MREVPGSNPGAPTISSVKHPIRSVQNIYKHFALFVVIVSLGVVSADGSSPEKTCTNAEAARALDEGVAVKNWSQAYRYYKRYGHCDDGAIAEGYTESVCVMLAEDWKQVRVLNNLCLRDKKFQSFVLRHVNAVTSDENLKAITTNAGQHCPHGLSKLCKMIENQANRSLKDQ